MSAKPVTGFRGAMPSERASERAGRYSLTEKEIMKKKRVMGPKCTYQHASVPASHPSIIHPSLASPAAVMDKDFLAAGPRGRP